MILGIPIGGDILPTKTMTRKEVSQTLGIHRVKKSKRKIFVGVGEKLKVMLDPYLSLFLGRNIRMTMS